MAEGLKLVIGADIKQAEQALKTFVSDVAVAGKATDDLGTHLTKLERQVDSFGGGVKKFSSSFVSSFRPLPASIKTTEAALQKLPRASGAATQSLINLGRVAQDAPFGIIGIANNINPLLESFQRLRAESTSTGGALKALAGSLLGGGGLGLAVSVVTGLMSYFALSSRGAKDEVKELEKTSNEAAEKQKEFQQALNSAAGAVIGQAKEIKNLRDILLSTDSATQQLTKSTIDQGLARFVFDSKNAELQKILTAQIEKQLIARKRLVGVAGLEEFTNDAATTNLEKQAKTLNEFRLGGDLTKDVKRLKELNETIGAAGGEINTLNVLGADVSQFFKGFLDGTKKAKDGTDDFVNRAKKLNEELEKVGFVAPVQFSFFDNAKEELEKARKVFADFASKNLKIQASVFTVDFLFTEPPPEKVQEALSKVEQLIKSGLITLPPVEIPVGFTAQEERNAAIISDFRKKFEQLGANLQLPEGALQDPALFNVLNAQFEALKNNIDFANTAANTLSNTFGNLVNRISQGQAPIQAFFQAIGQSILQLITQLIAAAIKAAIFKAILNGASGGIGGSILSFLKGGIAGFAAGGIVSGPTLALVGEGVGTSRSNPEVIAPLDQLKSMLGDFGGDSRPSGLSRSTLRGQDIRLALARTDRGQRRRGIR